MADLDRIDRKTLEILQRVARTSMTELAERIGRSTSPCSEWVRRLERQGVITGYHARVDPRAFGKSSWSATSSPGNSTTSRHPCGRIDSTEALVRALSMSRANHLVKRVAQAIEQQLGQGDSFSVHDRKPCLDRATLQGPALELLRRQRRGRLLTELRAHRRAPLQRCAGVDSTDDLGSAGIG